MLTFDLADQHCSDECLLQIMASMIEEADDVSQQLLDTILECVMSPKMQEQPQAYRWQIPHQLWVWVYI